MSILPIFQRAWRGLNILVLALFLVLVIWSRFYSLSSAGVWDNDAFQFLSISKDYAQGNIHPFSYKYGYVLLGALSIHMAGYHDYNLHYVSAIADVINIVLILLIMRSLSLPLLVSIAAASLYAFVPQVLYHARWPLSNPVAVTGVLCAIYCAMLALQSTSWRRIALLAASGFSAIYAAMAHPTTLSAFFIIGLFVVLTDISASWSRWFTRPAVIDSIVYAGGGFLAFLLLASLLWAGSTTDSSASKFQVHAIGTVDGFASALWKYAVGGLFSFRKASIGPAYAMLPMAAYVKSLRKVVFSELLPFWMWIVLLVVFVLFVVHMVVFRLRNMTNQSGKDEKRVIIGLIMGIVMAFLFVCSFFSLKISLVPRYFLPIVPLICMTIVGGGFIILRWWRIPQIVAALLICIPAIWGSTRMFQEYWPTYKGQISPVIFRQVAVVLGGKIDDRHRLLITPSTFDPGTGYFSLYFRPLPMRLRPGWKMQEVKDSLAQFGIRYVLVCGSYLSSVVCYRPYAANYGPLPEDYSLEQEYFDLNTLMRDVSVRLFYESPHVKIYELPEGGAALRAPADKGGIIEGTPFYVNHNILNPVERPISRRY